MINDSIDFQTHLDRVYKHYKICINTPGKVELLDLSHSLRIWDDLKEKIDHEKYPEIKRPNFTVTYTSKKKIAIIKTGKSVLANFPDGVYTVANTGSMFSCDEMTEDSSVAMGGLAKVNPNNSLIVHSFYYTEREFKDEDHQILGEKYEKREKFCFRYWMNSEIVRTYNINNIQILSISREKMITRMANAFDASHPRDENDQFSDYDNILSELRKYKIGELELPYYSLLSIAKEILLVMPSILRVNSYDDVLRKY
jgi:hypothetical protein